MVKSSSTPYCFVSGLANRATASTSSKYILTIRQQPQRAKVCGKERDRRPIDPPPIVQIKLADPSTDRHKDYLQSPYLFMCCNLVRVNDPDGDIVAPAHRALAGTVVSSLNRLKDVDNSDGGFFVFGDMSARIEGHFRLRFTLFEIIEGQVVHVMNTVSDPWTAYSSKTYPGISEATFLSRCFSDQGVRIRIRKDHHLKPKHVSPDTAHSATPHSPPFPSHELEHSPEENSQSQTNPSKFMHSYNNNNNNHYNHFNHSNHSMVPHKNIPIASRPPSGENDHNSPSNPPLYQHAPSPSYPGYHHHHNGNPNVEPNWVPSRPSHDPYPHDSHPVQDGHYHNHQQQHPHHPHHSFLPDRSPRSQHRAPAYNPITIPPSHSHGHKHRHMMLVLMDT
ncbi:hypothetical protein BGZ94_007923 [Podila epigama]|nr:hypothetical protein BGZ94_007923 [Podila epigama]